MSAYLSPHADTLWLAALLLLATLLLGFAVSRIRRIAAGRWASWALVTGSVSAMERLCADEPAGFRMLAISAALLWSMKAVVSVETRVDGQPPLTPRRWLAFAALWPGMRPAPFAALGGPACAGSGRLFRQGLSHLILGLVFVAAARLVWRHAPDWRTEHGTLVLVTALLLPGLSLILHFGLFNLLAGAWRLAGVECRPLFRAPLLSESLAEFWGRRWNLAFSEMTAVAVYRPLAYRIGAPWATLLAFLFSGVLHELAISVPVRAGYGLPLLYFCLQGLLVLGERRLEQSGRKVGRIWTALWLILPLPLLFHPPFLRGVVWPIIGIGE